MSAFFPELAMRGIQRRLRIEIADRVAAGCEDFDGIRADETGGTGNQDFHVAAVGEKARGAKPTTVNDPAHAGNT